MNEITIREDDISSECIVTLLSEHLQEMRQISPPESVHALGFQDLRAPEVTLWSAWDGHRLMGCAALKELDSENGEVKSMRTVLQYRGKGVASKLLEHVTCVARNRGYQTLKLETGAQAEFESAVGLYRKHDFQFCQPFGDYRLDPNSVCMEKRLVGPQMTRARLEGY